MKPTLLAEVRQSLSLIAMTALTMLATSVSVRSPFTSEHDRGLA